MGKTSLLQAAVIPRAQAAAGPGQLVLLAGRITPVAGPRTPTEHTASEHTAAPYQLDQPAWYPLAANPLTVGVLNSWSAGSAGGATVDPPPSIPEFLRRLRPVDTADAPPMLVVIDQFEQVFAAEYDEPHRQDLLDQLLAAVHQMPGLRLLLAVREDAVPRLEPLLAAVADAGRYRLGPLSPDAALDAVAGPVRGGDRSYAPGVAEEVVRNLRTSRIVDVLGESREVVAETVEPAQLQAACSAIWRALPAGIEMVTKELLYSPGDLDGALVRFCERAVQRVAVAQEVPERDVWSWLARTFITDLGGRGTAYEGVAGVGGVPKEIASQLLDCYLLTAESRLGSRWYQLTNDRLVAAVREAADRWAAETLAGGSSPTDILVAAEGALAEGNFALATQCAAEAVRTSGGDLHTRATALSCLGRVATEVGHNQEAESHYRAAASLFELVQDSAGAGRSLAGIGRILLRQRRYAEALAELYGAEVRLPSDLAIQIDLARALRDSGQLLAATAVLGATLTIAPGAVDALVARGLIRIETGEFSSALEDLDNAIRIRPSIDQKAEIRSARALARARLGRPA